MIKKDQIYISSKQGRFLLISNTFKEYLVIKLLGFFVTGAAPIAHKSAGDINIFHTQFTHHQTYPSVSIKLSKVTYRSWFIVPIHIPATTVTMVSKFPVIPTYPQTANEPYAL